MALDISQTPGNLLLPALGRQRGRAERRRRKNAEDRADTARTQALVGAGIGAVAGGFFGGGAVLGAEGVAAGGLEALSIAPAFDLGSAALGANVGARIGSGDIVGGFSALSDIAQADQLQQNRQDLVGQRASAQLAAIQLRDDLKRKAEDAGMVFEFSSKQLAKIRELNASKDDLSLEFITQRLSPQQFDDGIAEIESELDAIQKRPVQRKPTPLEVVNANTHERPDGSRIGFDGKKAYTIDAPGAKQREQEEKDRKRDEEKAAKSLEKLEARATSDATKAFVDANKDDFGKVVDTQTPAAQVAIAADAQQRLRNMQVVEQAQNENRTPTKQDFINANPEAQTNQVLDALEIIGELSRKFGTDPREWPTDEILGAVDAAKIALQSLQPNQTEQIQFLLTILTLAKELGAR